MKEGLEDPERLYFDLFVYVINTIEYLHVLAKGVGLWGHWEGTSHCTFRFLFFFFIWEEGMRSFPSGFWRGLRVEIFAVLKATSDTE